MTQAQEIYKGENDRPIPDPDWDYSEIWSETWEAKSKLEKLINYLGSIEDASPETNSALLTQFEIVGHQIAEAIDLLKH